jgi:predicted aldo/keto reductase-like oxidoreductase
MASVQGMSAKLARVSRCAKRYATPLACSAARDIAAPCSSWYHFTFGGGLMACYARREFLKTGLAAGALAVTGSLPLRAERQTATDWVTLGKSEVKVTRLAFGTGSFSGRVQRDLGQEGFTRLVRYAYDRGIRFFETAESYGDMHRMLGVALKGIPRDSYRIMSKVTTRDGVNPQDKIDELRKLASTEYFDVLLLHWQHSATWPSDTSRWQDGILEAESKKAVVSHGASVHGLPALRQMPGNKWLDVAMIRMNHKGTRMDAEDFNTDGLGNVSEVVTHVKQVRKDGMGVISMKLVGEGTFNREDRQAAMKFAFRNAGVDCVTVGYKNTGEIDEAIENLNLALA